MLAPWSALRRRGCLAGGRRGGPPSSPAAV